MGQVLSAGEAQKLGVVSEVLPARDLRERSWTVARYLAERPTLALRYTHEAITFSLKRQIRESLSLGLALEGLGSVQLAGWRMDQGDGRPIDY